MSEIDDLESLLNWERQITRQTPMELTLAEISQTVAPFLKALETLSEDQIQEEGNQIARLADSMWPWCERRVRVSGTGLIHRPDKFGEIQQQGTTLEDMPGTSYGFKILRDQTRPEGSKFRLVHLLACDLELVAEDEDPEPYIHDVFWRDWVHSELDAAQIVPDDLSPPADTKLLEEYYPDLLIDIDVAAMREGRLTDRLRALSEVDLSIVNTMPQEHIAELLRYMTSLGIITPGQLLRLDNATLARWEEVGDDELGLVVEPNDTPLRIIGRGMSFTIGELRDINPESGEIEPLGNIFCIQVSGFAEDGSSPEMVIPLSTDIRARPLPRSVRSLIAA